MNELRAQRDDGHHDACNTHALCAPGINIKSCARPKQPRTCHRTWHAGCLDRSQFTAHAGQGSHDELVRRRQPQSHAKRGRNSQQPVEPAQPRVAARCAAIAFKPWPEQPENLEPRQLRIVARSTACACRAWPEHPETCSEKTARCTEKARACACATYYDST